MDETTLKRIDAAISDLRSIDSEKAQVAGPIIERLMAVRRGLCNDPNACHVCETPCETAVRPAERAN